MVSPDGLTLYILKSHSFLDYNDFVKNSSKNAAAYVAEQPLFLDSFLKLKIRGL
jgi:hypothetical protein